MRKNCTHELSERETACADGACPICLKEELVKAQAENARLADDNRAWRTQEAHLLSKVGEVQEKMDRALSRKGILDLRNQLEATKRELLDAQGKAVLLKDENARLAAQWAVAEAKCKEACGECVPSGGYDYFDEVCGLLRVTRGQRDTAQAENRKLEQEAIRRIAHLNRLGTWAAQDPTGPLPVWMGSTVQSWVLEELKAALGSAYNPTSWQPEVVRDDLNKRIAQLETENTRLANERQILVAQCKELHASTFDIEKLKSENARLAAETTRLLDALIAADYILGRVQTITLKGDDNPPKYHWGEAADLVHSTLFQYQLEYAASQPQKPDRTEGIDSLKAENARLVAAFENIERMVQRWGDCQATYDQLIVEFARLRAAREGKQ